MAVMRLRLVAAILVVGALGVGAWLWLGPRPAKAPDAFAVRFALERQSTPPPAVQRYAVRLRVLDALAFSPSFLAAPHPLYTLGRVDLSGAEGTKLALAPPVMGSAVPFANGPATTPAPPAAPPLANVPLPRRNPERPFVPDDRVLDDAQIAGLKARLKLTAAQERSWAPIEAELRGLQWRRSGPGRNGTPTLEVDALLRLKAASDKLMEALREDQKREVKTLMAIVGL
jgi:hypothetical protein